MTTSFNKLSDHIKVLRRFQQFGYKSAILAGGAIRDDYAGKSNQIADYDFFLWDPRHSNEFATTTGFQPEGFEQSRLTEFQQLIGTLQIEQIFARKGYGPVSGPKLTAIWEATSDTYDTYQIMYTAVDPVEYVNKYFDLGMCKAYCDGNKIRYTPDFLHDMKNRTFTIVGHDMSQAEFDHVIDYHIDKLERRYPFDIEIAPHNLKLFQNYMERNS